MDDLLNEFLTETGESISTLDVELVNLEKNPNDQTILSNIFRLVHTVKGTCGFLGLPRLESLAHAGENVMSKFRDGELEVTQDAVTLILQSIDRIKEILDYLEANEQEPDGNDNDLIEQLNNVAEGKHPKAGKESPVEEEKTQEIKEEKAEETKEETKEETQGGPVLNENGFPVAAELLAEFEEAMEQGVEAPSEEDIAKEMEQERAKEEEKKKNSGSAVVSVDNKKEVVEKSKPKKKAESALANQSIRVNVELLENLMTLVSELVLTRNQLLQMVRGVDDSEFTAPLQRLSHITTDLQEGVMKTRMQPIGNAWSKLPRIVRDLCIETGKKIELRMFGSETELDRQILELIRDPLTHMVRNSADHGLEPPEERVAYGKPETGYITLNAYHEGGHIIVEIYDDGRGLNIEKIKDKIISNSLATKEDLEGLSEQQIAQYIFKAGFSTAEKVTSVSGRGVGMDVVKTNIEKIGGSVELKTKEGKGSTFTIKIPLTLAIVSALIVESGGERFAIPQISVLELVRATNKSEQKIEMINNSPVLRLRDRLLPLVNLRNILQINEIDKEGEEDFIVVCQVGTYSFGIVVDKVFDTEEIVVKPVAPILRDITMFSGNTILGDGSVIMILDPNGIASSVGEVGDHSPEAESAKVRTAQSEDVVSLLVFRAGSNDLKTVPLALVARLEEFPIEEIEYSYGKPVVQYRGQLMPLVKVEEHHSFKEEGKQSVLVFSEGDKTMGLVVDEIIDIVEDNLEIELQADVQGLVGSAVVNGKATDVIDAGFYLEKAFGDWFRGSSALAYGHKEPGKVLIIDDSAFFRNLISPTLSVAGYKSVSVESGKQALELREKGHMFEAIISDIEMPDMDGFELAKQIKSEGAWADTPMIALSARSSDEYRKKGLEVGFDDYVSKSDRDSILDCIERFIEHKKKEEVKN